MNSAAPTDIAASDPSMDLLPPKKTFQWPGFSFGNCCKPPANDSPGYPPPEEAFTAEPTKLDKEPPVNVVSRDLDLGDDIPDLHSVSSHDSGSQQERKKGAPPGLALASPKGMENASKLLMQLCHILLSIMFLDKVFPASPKKAKNGSDDENGKMPSEDQPDTIPEMPEEEGMEVPFMPMVVEEEGVTAK
mmetsp:Transcript_115873/g.173164  ORF Transcript_115873/g.173164 Transcript_115873/m.173164 type:complete len:190 (-) Transcript_115873:216-785(-)